MVNFRDAIEAMDAACRNTKDCRACAYYRCCFQCFFLMDHTKIRDGKSRMEIIEENTEKYLKEKQGG